jgi:hypothetical protein
VKKYIEIVEKILKNDDHARNNYAWLYFEVLRAIGFEIPITIKDLKSIPSPETILKASRTIQNNEQRHTPNKETAEIRKRHQNHFQKVIPKEEAVGMWKNSQYG